MKDIYIFGTCRICYPVHEHIKFVEHLRIHHSRYYTIGDDVHIYTQPVNYTTKLRDIYDSILYMVGGLYADLNPKTNTTLNSVLFRGHKTPILPQTHPLGNGPITFSKIIIEVFSIKENIINTKKYGEEFFLQNLPWKIHTYYEHTIQFDENDIIQRTMSKEECFDTLDKIRAIVRCEILIIGPYVSKKVPDFVNSERINTQNILKEYCSLKNVDYFDLSESIASTDIEVDETHFNETGTKILTDVMYTFMVK